MWILSLIPFILQAIIMIFDEGYFHIRRGLPTWEKIGHPLDTLSVIVCMGFVLFVPFSTQTLCIYSAIACFSTIFVTKDEFVHKFHCSRSENWLHALLFTLHPITLISAGFIWPVTQNADVSPWVLQWLNRPEKLFLFLKLQFGMMVLFFFYQVIFWNFVWKNKPAIQQ